MNDPARLRRELVAYLHRLVLHPATAEDLAQDTFARALAAEDRAPTEAEGRRRWLFRIATNLAIDWLRRQRRQGGHDMQALRADAEGDPAFVARSLALVGTPETALLAEEHLAACFACTLSRLPERQAAALLLVEVHAFSVEETAETLGIPFNAAKNALQDGRRTMTARYAQTCALIAKQGVCHQCEELSGFFRARPVALDAADPWASRVARLRALRERAPGTWHMLLLGRLPRDEGR